MTRRAYERTPDDDMFDDKEHPEIDPETDYVGDEPLELDDDDMEQLWGDSSDEEEEDEE